ncbi:MAG: amidohydrolase family protein [Christensenellales bacterium]|jgi:predicted TIM-barrel fold metal-dependent hydrolase
MKILDAFSVIGIPGLGGTEPGFLLEEMRKNGVEKSVIVPYDRRVAVDNAEANQYILDTVYKYPDSFIGFATVNPWYGERAAAMLREAFLSGLKGVYFKSTVQGFMPDDEMLYPLLDICAEYGAPAFFHTGTPVNALPFTVMSQAKRYPSVNFILGHMGANDYVGDAFAAAQLCDNIYLETSLNLTALIKSAANILPNRVIFGSGSPRSVMEFELKKTREAVSDKATLEKILSGNLTRVLGGRP